MDEDAKQKAINGYRAETLKKAKQKKAKESAEGKAKAKAAAVPGEAGNLPSFPAVQVPLTVSTSAASSGGKHAALPPGSLKFDDVNRGYYEAVQHDQDAILQHFGKAYASEGALAIASKGCQGEGRIQAWNVCWVISFKNILLLCICATLVKFNKLMYRQNDNDVIQFPWHATKIIDADWHAAIKNI